MDKIKAQMDLVKAAKMNELHKKVILIVLAIVGALSLAAGIAYAIYRHLSPKYVEDFDEELPDPDDDEEDFFEEEIG